MNMENNIQLLTEVLDQYENGELVPENSARKVYLTEEHRHKKIITWVHDHELRGHLLLRGMAKQVKRDLLRTPNNK